MCETVALSHTKELSMELTDQQKKERQEYSRQMSQERAQRFRELIEGKEGVERLVGQMIHEIETYFEDFRAPMPLRILSQRYNSQIKRHRPTFQEFVNEIALRGDFIVLQTQSKGRRFLILPEQLEKMGLGLHSPELDDYIELLDKR